jgi:AcrR family transcriptional regulator
MDAARRPAGRRERKKEITRTELLAAGRRLFADRGLYESRIEDLSRMAGIAKGTLYGYFESKEELIEAVVSTGFAELMAYLHGEVHGAASRRETIERIVDGHLEFFSDNPDLMRIFHQVRGLLKFDARASSPLRSALDVYLHRLERLLASHARGRLATGPSEREVAIVLFGAISGVASVSATVEGIIPGRKRSPRLRRALIGTLISYEQPERPTLRGSVDAPSRGKRS